MLEKFTVRKMRELSFFLGIQVQRTKNILFLSQQRYVGNLLTSCSLGHYRKIISFIFLVDGQVAKPANIRCPGRVTTDNFESTKTLIQTKKNYIPYFNLYLSYIFHSNKNYAKRGYNLLDLKSRSNNLQLHQHHHLPLLKFQSFLLIVITLQ